MNKIGRYEILSKIGAGGFGTVYRARDSMLERDIALKVLTQRLHEGDAARKRFLNEAKVAAALSHPNIVVIHELGIDEGVPYIAMELLPGADLRALIRRKVPLGLRQKLGIALQTARALRHAHAHGVIHRDVKPENIRLLPSGLVKLMDFGIAKASSGAEGQLTTAGSMLGSASYMSPEQARGEPLGVPADIFSYGVVLYELLASRRPFNAPSLPGLIYRILSEEAPPLEDPELPPALVGLVERCLMKSAGDRFPDFEPVVQTLIQLRQSVASQGGSTEPLRLPSLAGTLESSDTVGLSDVTAASELGQWPEDTQDLAIAGRWLSVALFLAGIAFVALLGWGAVWIFRAAPPPVSPIPAAVPRPTEPPAPTARALPAATPASTSPPAATPTASPTPSRPPSRAPTAANGRLRLSVPAGTYVRIDGQAEIQAPLPPLPLPPGRHSLRLRRAGAKPKSLSFYLEPGKDLELRVELEPQ